MALDMPKPCEFLSLTVARRGSFWVHEKVDSAVHPVVGLVLQVGDVEKFPQAFCLKKLDPFSEPASRVHVSQP